MARVGGPKALSSADAAAMMHEATGGSLRDADHIPTAALRAAARRKRKTIERAYSATCSSRTARAAHDRHNPPSIPTIFEQRGNEKQPIRDWGGSLEYPKTNLRKAIEKIKKTLGLGRKDNAEIDEDGNVIGDGDVVGNIIDEADDCR